MATVFNHLGHCVRDLERAKRFYVELLEFEFRNEIQPPDEGSAQLLALTPPVGLTASYLRRDGLVLELLHYADAGAEDHPPRVMNELGLTHISLSVDDIPATCALVEQFGGTVLRETQISGGIFVRDPDGQLIELLPMAYAERVAAEA